MNINHCIHCGTESEASWRFCRRCGTALENLEAAPKTAKCSNCHNDLADDWRFCPNCGTGTDGASPMAAGGSSSDEVADPTETPADTAPATAPDEVADPTETPADTAPATAPDVVAPTPTAPEPTPDPDPIAPAPITAVAPGVSDTEPVVSAPKVSFEPAAAEPTPPVEPPPVPSDIPAARDLDMMTSPPAPPADPSLGDVEEIAASRATAQAPPTPHLDAPDAVIVEPVVTAPSAEPEADEPARRAVIDVTPPPTADPFAGEPAKPVDEAPAVIIPPPRSEPELRIPQPSAESQAPAIRKQIPRPIGAPHEQSKTAIPRPLGTPVEDQTQESAPESRQRGLKTTPAVATGDLPPIDGRTFTNPGILGQGVQLAMLIAAAFGVAMIVAFTVLNNRLDAYATTGESLTRVESVQSIINTWMRPLLVLALLVAYVAAVLWARRVLRNISVFDKFVPETALWMWIVPGANIFVLWQHLELAWKGSDVYAPDDEQWRTGKLNWWSFAFALLAIIAFGVIIYAWLFMSSETFENAIDANAVSIIGYGLVVATLLCGVRAIGDVVDRQQNRVQQYG